MKKPEEFAGPGWYESPDTEGAEQYWNGKRWKKESRMTNKSGESNYLPVDFQLGRFLFRKPYLSDWAFILLAGWVAFLSIARFQELRTSGGLHTGSGALITGVGDAVIRLVGSFWIFWVISLLWLIPRRRIDIRKLAPIMSSDEIDLNKIEMVQNLPWYKRNKKLVFAVIAVAVVGALMLAGSPNGSSDPFSKYADTFLSEEQSIGSSVQDWNKEMISVSSVITGISNGKLTAENAAYQMAVALPKVQAVQHELGAKCENLPQPLQDSGTRSVAVNTMFNMLRVTCDVLPQVWIEALALYKAQISPTSTQADLSYHSGQIDELISRRKAAVTAGINAMKPYLNASQLEAANRMLSLVA